MNTDTMNAQAIDEKVWTMMSEKLGLEKEQIKMESDRKSVV